jgi:hypothetical protein
MGYIPYLMKICPWNYGITEIKAGITEIAVTMHLIRSGVNMQHILSEARRTNRHRRVRLELDATPTTGSGGDALQRAQRTNRAAAPRRAGRVDGPLKHRKRQ